jgi:hypothetical protein
MAFAALLFRLLSQSIFGSQVYDYRLIAQTGGGFSSLKNNPTINDSGHVAFVAVVPGNGQALVRWNGNQNEVLDTKYNGSYGSGAIDDSDRVATRFSADTGGNSYSAIQRYSGPGTFLALNEAGNARNPVTGEFLFLLGSFMDQVAISSIGTVAYGAVAHTPLTYFMVNNNSLRVYTPPFPVIAHDVDRVLVRPLAEDNSPILLYMASQFSIPDTIVSSGDFTRTGQRPGVNEAATIAAFYGERNVGGSAEKGIYVSVKTSGGWQVQPVVRLSNGFDSFGQDCEIAVSSPDCGQ